LCSRTVNALPKGIYVAKDKQLICSANTPPSRQFPNLQRSPARRNVTRFLLIPRYADNRAITLSSDLDFVPHLAGLPKSQRHTNPALSPLAIKPPPGLIVKSIIYPLVLCLLNPFPPVFVSCSIYHHLVIRRLECGILSTWMRR
jgi:hypothetical protein